MRLTNTTDQLLMLPNGAVVPAKGKGAVSDEAWRKMRSADTVSAWLCAGYLVTGEPERAEPEAVPPAAPIVPVPEATALKARYPEFTAVANELAALVLADAAEMVDVTWRTADQVPAVLAYAAHLLAMEGEPARSNAIAGGGTPPVAGGSVGVVSRIKVGDVETQFAGTASSGGGSGGIGSDAWLAGTAYGQQFLRLRRRNFPAVAVV